MEASQAIEAQSHFASHLPENLWDETPTRRPKVIVFSNLRNGSKQTTDFQLAQLPQLLHGPATASGSQPSLPHAVPRTLCPYSHRDMFVIIHSCKPLTSPPVPI